MRCVISGLRLLMNPEDISSLKKGFQAVTLTIYGEVSSGALKKKQMQECRQNN
jgi:hypothetical protein